jgi:hypothetical protein
MFVREPFHIFPPESASSNTFIKGFFLARKNVKMEFT